jgi:hypothetical protein
MVGVELELAEWGTLQEFAEPKHYRYIVDHDSSVQPSQQEMVLSPMRGDHLLVGLREVSEHMAGYGCTVNDTCGYHVHVDAGDYNLFHLRRLLQLYANIEDRIYSMLPPPRRESRFCYRLLPQSVEMLGVMHKARTLHDLKIAALTHMYGCTRRDLQGEEFRMVVNVNHDQWIRLKSNKYLRNDNLRNMRYQGLNLHSWFYRGSVEFRMWPGTMDVIDVVNWALFCAWLVEFAGNWTDSKAFAATWETVLGEMPRSVAEWARGKVEQYKPKPKLKVVKARTPAPATGIQTEISDQLRESLRQAYNTYAQSIPRYTSTPFAYGEPVNQSYWNTEDAR